MKLVLGQLAVVSAATILLGACATNGGYPNYPGENASANAGYGNYPAAAEPAPAATAAAPGTPADILFNYDSAALDPEAQQQIDQIAADLKGRYPDMEIDVNGYADTAGMSEHNVSLSRARAMAVADELMKQGIDPGRIHTHAYGESELRIPTPNGVAQPLNRRVEIVLQPKLG